MLTIRFHTWIFKQIDLIFEKIDLKLKDSITGLSQINLDEVERVVAEELSGHLAARSHRDVFDIYERIFSVIDQKASALLTHISVMIAVTALLLTSSESPLIDLLSAAVLFLYVLTALLVLRLIRFWSFDFPRTVEKDGEWVAADKTTGLKILMRDSFRRELFFRGRLYRMSLNLTSFITLISAALAVFYGISLLTK